ncbi:MAG: small multi-drug export protein [Desulfurococcales archaeon]|nr:small multi-drug export protein [Desulfurococcales archaeon]
MVDGLAGPILDSLKAHPYLAILAASLAPGIEPRYAVLLGVSIEGVSLTASLAISLAGLVILSSIMSLGVSAIDSYMEKALNTGSRLYRVARLYRRVKLSGYKRAKASVEKWGLLGLILFIAIPLPFTGIYTGALASIPLGIRGYRLFAALLVGGFISLASTTLALALARF